MQLDRVPPRLHGLIEIPGTFYLPVGVEHASLAQLPEPFVVPFESPRRPRWKSWLALSVACWTLLGQGESNQIDSRFVTPGTTIVTYWDALGRDDVNTVAECFADPSAVVPRPGAVWFLPKTRRLEVRAMRYGAGQTGDLLATYEVRFVAVGSNEELRFVMGSELTRVRGEWRIVGWADDASLPDFRSNSPPIDI